MQTKHHPDIAGVRQVSERLPAAQVEGGLGAAFGGQPQLVGGA